MKHNFQVISNAVFSAIDAGQSSINLNDIDNFKKLDKQEKVNYIDYFKDRLNNSTKLQLDYTINYSTFIITIQGRR
jgi:hypothetical protein